MASAALLGTDYVQVEPELRLPAVLQGTEDAIRRFDPELRLRMARKRELYAEGCGYILERKTRRGTKPVHTETKRDAAGTLIRQADPDVEVASRDGYLVLGPVHFWFMGRPQAIVDHLRQCDHAVKNGEQRFQEIVDGQNAAREKRQADRLSDARHHFRSGYDILQRTGALGGTDRLRVNNAGGTERFNVITVTDRRRVTPEGFVVEGPSAGVIPAKESSDVHPPRAAGRP